MCNNCLSILAEGTAAADAALQEVKTGRRVKSATNVASHLFAVVTHGASYFVAYFVSGGVNQSLISTLSEAEKQVDDAFRLASCSPKTVRMIEASKVLAARAAGLRKAYPNWLGSPRFNPVTGAFRMFAGDLVGTTFEITSWGVEVFVGPSYMEVDFWAAVNVYPPDVVAMIGHHFHLT